ncbi:PREDICTED: E3 ubiquitin-protein ligase DTX1 [Charadrius vociferus]|uniref:E3 ubiquitin-protein ligase DTX1 n=1 Tax=Charadrius vociferus TaxID=50402 RepID=UPI0005215DE7|nr:PREDICTED: E3 ubiquitin-protein ligase DTX1 [Charadrius vociferus]
MHQFRQDTGTMRPVRRNFYDPSSAPGKGIVWEWENDNNSWTPYDMDICITIQNAYEKQHPWLDLSSLGFCYLIYFSSMSQMNRQTQRKRRLRRRMDLAYPLTMGSIPKSQSWPVGANTGTPCSCPQCLLVNSTRAASNAILASQRRKLYPGAVRQSSTFAGLWGGHGHGDHTCVPYMDGNNTPRGCGVPALPVKNLNGTGPVHPALAGMTGILMCAAGLPVCLTRAPKPILHPPPVSKSDIKPVPGVNGICRKTKKKHLKKSKEPPVSLRSRGVTSPSHPSTRARQDCTICMERLVTSSGYEGVLSHRGIKPELVGKLGKCGHMYHLLCLLAMYNNGNKDGSLQCPTCKAIYGEKTGTQPPGKMEFHLIPHSLPGYTDSKTIRIVYDIPTGIQGPEHPNPGKKFTARGFPRHCYLPDNEKGRKPVVWNEIHHKTEFGSNLTGHGYPDPNYLDNVLAELLAQGVSEATLKD